MLLIETYLTVAFFTALSTYATLAAEVPSVSSVLTLLIVVPPAPVSCTFVVSPTLYKTASLEGGVPVPAVKF